MTPQLRLATLVDVFGIWPAATIFLLVPAVTGIVVSLARVIDSGTRRRTLNCWVGAV